jgi:hypothetical protein
LRGKYLLINDKYFLQNGNTGAIVYVYEASAGMKGAVMPLQDFRPAAAVTASVIIVEILFWLAILAGVPFRHGAMLREDSELTV